MRDVELKMKERAAELLKSGEVARVIGWKKGEFYFDPEPSVFETEAELENFVYNGFCGANLSKYLIAASKKPGTTAVFLKPCDTYSFNELVKEHRVVRENIHVVAIECQGKLDISKIKKLGADAVTEVEELGEKVMYPLFTEIWNSRKKKCSSKSAFAVKERSIKQRMKRLFFTRCPRRKTTVFRASRSWKR